MLGLGKPFPQFQLKAVVSEDAENSFKDISSQNLKGRWSIVFFYPKDFTFVCPTEIRGFSDFKGNFAERGAEVYAVSTDSEYVHLAWRQSNPLIKGIEI